MTDFLKRKMMYKSPHTSPSAWKDAYRVKCFERLRERRANLIEKFRHHVNDHPKNLLMESTSPAKVVTDVMEIEWNALSPNRRFPSLSSRSDSSSWFEDPEDEVMREALLEIQKELQNEEEWRMNEFFLHESKELDSKVKLFLHDDVICPICQKGKLEEAVVPTLNQIPTSFATPPRTAICSANALKCSCCGVLLSKNNKDVGITLEQVRRCLHDTINNHNNGCSSSCTLGFSVIDEENGGSSNILVTCSFCDWMSFLI
ncbi:RPA-interacting protein A [Armadillidium nasatum]|uniref:RPA-interacting protein A n=1 Tax=Armadillidium nasatum TaxID=96803 RepID=A0A5N5T1P9_9CRUS|nr:RPA-interacting protein A [Armadillidium nasatum]